MRLRSTAGADPVTHGGWARPSRFGRADMGRDGPGATPGPVSGSAEAEDPLDLLTVRQGLALLDSGDDRVDPLVVAAFDPADPYVAKVRAVRAKLMASAARRRRGGRQRLAVVSIRAGDEGAILAANLAVVLAQLDGGTLLVDGDMGTPTLDRLFRLPNSAGVSELLTGAPGPVAAVPTALEGLWLLPAGEGGGQAESLLEKASLAQAADGWPLPGERLLFYLDRAREAPVDLGHVLDRFDAVVLVVRRGVTTLAEARAAIDDLDRRQVPIAGQILC